MNKVIISGNLARDPESSVTNSGVAVCRFTVAVSRYVSGEKKAEFIDVTCWRTLADNCAVYLAKGSKVVVTGSLAIDEYTTKDGDARKKYYINAEEVEFVSSPNKKEEKSVAVKTVDTAQQMKLEEVKADDFPF